MFASGLRTCSQRGESSDKAYAICHIAETTSLTLGLAYRKGISGKPETRFYDRNAQDAATKAPEVTAQTAQTYLRNGKAEEQRHKRSTE